MPNRDVLNFITSGRMSSLRELSIAIDYKDWVRPPIMGSVKEAALLDILLTRCSITSYRDFLKFPISGL